MKTSSVFLTVLIAATIGLLAGVLYAPQSGRRTRKRLMKRARRLNVDLNKLAHDSGETIKDVKESLIDFTDNAGHTFEKLLKKR